MAKKISFKFVHINRLCDRLAAGEIDEQTFNRLCAKYEDGISFLDAQPTVIENGVRYKQIEAGIGTRKLRVA